jgi:hypothetical protein
VSPDKALVTVTVAGVIASYTMDYQHGHGFIEASPHTWPSTPSAWTKRSPTRRRRVAAREG